jgi:hypothetical protein
MIHLLQATNSTSPAEDLTVDTAQFVSSAISGVSASGGVKQATIQSSVT